MKGWKTIIFNILAGILLLVDKQADLWGIPPGTAETILVVGNVILRFFTTGPAAPVAKAIERSKQ